MSENIFFIAAVAIGALIIFTVLINGLRSKPIVNAAVTLTLILIGFLLISSPLWKNITMKGQNFEVKLFRDITTKQFKNYIEMAEIAEKSLNKESASELRSQIDDLKMQLEELKKPTTLKLNTSQIQLFLKATRNMEITTKTAVAGIRG